MALINDELFQSNFNLRQSIYDATFSTLSLGASLGVAFLAAFLAKRYALSYSALQALYSGGLLH